MLFGNKNDFAIEYNLIQHPYGDEFGLMLDSWGELHLWVEGIDLLQMYESGYKNDKTFLNYQWNLNMIAAWFSANLYEIISIIDFPNGIQAMNSMSYLEKNQALTQEFGTEAYWKWHKNANEWLDAHWFRAAADGSNLPHLFFRRVDMELEICWNNEGLLDGRGIFFCSHEGCKRVDLKVFCTVVKDFLSDFARRFEAKYPMEMKQILDNMEIN